MGSDPNHQVASFRREYRPPLARQLRVCAQHDLRGISRRSERSCLVSGNRSSVLLARASSHLNICRTTPNDSARVDPRLDVVRGHAQQSDVSDSASTRIDCLLSGFLPVWILVCDLYLTRGEWTPSFIWDALALSGWPLVWLLGRNTGHLVLPFVIVVLYLAAFKGRICSSVFSNRVITDIGGMCYSIYLFHFVVIYTVKHQTAGLHIGENFWVYYCLQACMILPLVLISCGAFFLVVERPCTDREWPQQLWRSSRARALSAARDWIS